MFTFCLLCILVAVIYYRRTLTVWVVSRTSGQALWFTSDTFTAPSEGAVCVDIHHHHSKTSPFPKSWVLRPRAKVAVSRHFDIDNTEVKRVTVQLETHAIRLDEFPDYVGHEAVLFTNHGTSTVDSIIFDRKHHIVQLTFTLRLPTHTPTWVGAIQL